MRLPSGIFIIDQEAELLTDQVIRKIRCDIRAVPVGGFKSLTFRDHALPGYLEKSQFKSQARMQIVFEIDLTAGRTVLVHIYIGIHSCRVEGQGDLVVDVVKKQTGLYSEAVLFPGQRQIPGKVEIMGILGYQVRISPEVMIDVNKEEV